MKTYLTYGLAIALAGALLNLILYFAGYHSDYSKLSTAQWIGGGGGLAISIACIILGTKARRAEMPPSEDFGYGSAFAAGLMITLVAALIGIVTNYLYMHIINPGFNDLVIHAKVAEFEAKGLSATQLEQMEKDMRFFTSPLIQCVMVFIGGMIGGTIVSLITAAFLKRSANDQPPAVA